MPNDLDQDFSYADPTAVSLASTGTIVVSMMLPIMIAFLALSIATRFTVARKKS